MRRMRSVCGKLKAVVTEEFAREDADVPYSQEDIEVTMSRGIEHFVVAPYEHLVFDCVLPAGEHPQGQPALPAHAVPTAAAVLPGVVPSSSTSAVTTRVPEAKP
jgi:hypothetical protein